MGIDARGLGTVLWRALDPRPEVTTTSVFAARETPEGGIGQPVVLNTMPFSGSMRLAVLPDGTALAVWVEGMAPHRLMAARFE